MGSCKQKGKRKGAMSSFIASPTFQGAQAGYVFKRGENGVGYYLDVVERGPGSNNSSDPLPSGFFDSGDSGARSAKRSRDEFEQQSSGSGSGSGSRGNADLDMLEQAERALGKEDAIIELDASSLKTMLVKLDKCIATNHAMRAKHFDRPELFMDSELELHSAISDLNALAAYPALYIILGQTHADGETLTRLVDLISHKNASIVAAVMELFAEMSDVNNEDAPDDRDSEHITEFVRMLLQGNKQQQQQQQAGRGNYNPQQQRDLLVGALGTFKWERRQAGGYDEDTEKGAKASLVLLENLLEAAAAAAAQQHQQPLLTGSDYSGVVTTLLAVLSAEAVAGARFHPLHLHVSEVLSSVLSTSSSSSGGDNTTTSSSSNGTSNRLLAPSALEPALETLLAAQAAYVKRAPANGEEEEYFLNLCLSLASLVSSAHDIQEQQDAVNGDDNDSSSAGKRTLIGLEGVNLQLLLLKRHAADINVQGALQVLSHATSGHTVSARAVCADAVSWGALKHVSPFLMGASALKRGKKSKKKGGNGAERELVLEHCIAILTNLVTHLHAETEQDAGARLAAKFTENGGEKLRRVCALFARYHVKVAAVESDLKSRENALQEQIAQLRGLPASTSSSARLATEAAIADTVEELTAVQDEEGQYARRLLGGLATLQHTAVLTAFAVLANPSLLPVATEALQKAGDERGANGGLAAVIGVLREKCAFLVLAASGDSNDSNDSNQTGSSNNSTSGKGGRAEMLLSFVSQLDGML